MKLNLFSIFGGVFIVFVIMFIPQVLTTSNFSTLDIVMILISQYVIISLITGTTFLGIYFLYVNYQNFVTLKVSPNFTTKQIFLLSIGTVSGLIELGQIILQIEFSEWLFFVLFIAIFQLAMILIITYVTIIYNKRKQTVTLPKIKANFLIESYVLITLAQCLTYTIGIVILSVVYRNSFNLDNNLIPTILSHLSDSFIPLFIMFVALLIHDFNILGPKKRIIGYLN